MDENKRELFKKIIQTEPRYDKNKLSKEAIDLMKQLLNKAPEKRIKIEDIPTHPWFSSLNFSKIMKLAVTPPISPNIVYINSKSKISDEDVTNIDPMFLNENVYSPVKKHKEYVNHGILQNKCFFRSF